MFSPKVTTKDNGDGTQTVTTVTYKVDGTKVVKRKTEPIPPPHSPTLPANVNRTNRNSIQTVASLEGVKQVLQEVLGKAHMDNSTFHSAVNRAIPAEFILLASQDDVTQAQEDYYASQHFGLPDNRFGNAGSVATCALLQLMHENPKRLVAGNGTAKPLDCRQIIHQIKTRVQDRAGLEAKPTISSSRPLGPPGLKDNQYAPFYIVPPNFTGARRALLIGCVAGEGDDLKGPPNDITNIKNFLIDHCGFKHSDIEVLRDDIHVSGNIQRSTKKNIMDGFAKLVKLSKPKDVCFVQYSGHGGRLGDNLYILPADYKESGHILDDDILLDLIKYMPAQVHTTMLVDCCYSGVIGDLPYTLNSNTQDGDPQRIGTYYDTNTRQETIQHKEQPTREYLAKKEARSKWKNVTRLGSIAATYAQEFAKEVEKGSSVFAEQAREIVDRKTKEMRQSANNMRQSATEQANLRRSKTQPMPPPPKLDDDVPAPPKQSRTPPPPASKPTPTPIRRVNSTAAPETMRPASKPQPIRRNRTMPRGAATHSMPKEPAPKTRKMPSIPHSPTRSPKQTLRRTKTDMDYAREAEEAARRAAVGQRESAATPLRRTKTDADYAREADEAARRSAVGQREAAGKPARGPPRRSKSVEDAAFEAEVAARRAAVGQRETVAQSFDDRGEAARRAAVEKSREEAAAARAEALDEEARRAAVERSKEESARRRAQEEEEKARREAVERSKREKEELSSKRAEEAARKEAVERSKREAEAARQQK